MQDIPSHIGLLYQMYMPSDEAKAKMTEQQFIKALTGSIDSLIHLVVGMMIEGNLTAEKMEQLAQNMKGKNA